MYLELLLDQFEHGSISSDTTVLAASLQISHRDFLQPWNAIKNCFSQIKSGRLVNRKLAAERAKAVKFSKAQSASGLRGADARWQAHRLAIGKPNATPMGSDGPRAVPYAIRTASTKDLKKKEEEEKTREPTARSKRPIFSGQRFAVFEWQLDDLMRLLGAHTEAFDLHAWFFALDARAVKSGEVVPQRDSGAWLQARTLEEARRRGLPIASSDRPAFEPIDVDAVRDQLKREGVL